MSDPVLYDNLRNATSTGERLDVALKGAQTLDICVGYLSTGGLEQLDRWIEDMAPESRVRLLVGMAPSRWKPGKASPPAAAAFLAKHLAQQGRRDPRNRTRAAAVLQRLELHRAAGRLEVRQRLSPKPLHAKLYLWTDRAAVPAALVGSSNLTGQGLREQGELNLQVSSAGDAAHLAAWFDDRWREPASYHARQVLAAARSRLEDSGDTSNREGGEWPNWMLISGGILILIFLIWSLRNLGLV